MSRLPRRRLGKGAATADASETVAHGRHRHRLEFRRGERKERYRRTRHVQLAGRGIGELVRDLTGRKLLPDGRDHLFAQPSSNRFGAEQQRVAGHEPRSGQEIRLRHAVAERQLASRTGRAGGGQALIRLSRSILPSRNRKAPPRPTLASVTALSSTIAAVSVAPLPGIVPGSCSRRAIPSSAARKPASKTAAGAAVSWARVTVASSRPSASAACASADSGSPSPSATASTTRWRSSSIGIVRAIARAGGTTTPSAAVKVAWSMDASPAPESSVRCIMLT